MKINFMGWIASTAEALVVALGIVSLFGNDSRLIGIGISILAGIAFVFNRISDRIKDQELVDLRERIRPRSIKKNDRYWFIKNLKDLSLPPLFMMEHEPGDPESQQYISEIWALIQEGASHAAINPAGIGSWIQPRTDRNVVISLTMLVKEKTSISPLVEILTKTFRDSGITIGLENRPSLTSEQFVISAGKKPI